MPQRIGYVSVRPAGIRADDDAARRERDRFYGSKRWRELRARHLARHPLCVDCERRGETRAANVVHHVVDRLLDPTRALDPSNLEGLCSPCHTAHHKAGGGVRRTRGGGI